MSASDEEPICTRSLTYRSEHGTRDLTVRVWRPVPDSERPDDSFSCRFEISGLPNPIEGNAAGVDSMQALICALQGVHFHLSPLGRSVIFLDAPYQEFAQIVVGDIDPGRRRRVLEILAEEQYSVELLVKRRAETLEAVRQFRKQRR
jgi:hypothetical protein